MPLPDLKPWKHEHVDRANAREFAKRTVLTGDPVVAAEQIGGPLQLLAVEPEAQRLLRVIDAKEREALAATNVDNPAFTSAALESREGRKAWLQAVISGELKMEGAFGSKRAYPPAVQTTCMKLLLQMNAELLQKHEITVTNETVLVFAIPDNGRLPDSEDIVEMPDELASST